jgi:hypothetical protein
MNTTLDAINNAKDFIKFSSNRYRNAYGTRDKGDFQIHSSSRLFSVFAVEQPDGSVIGNYYGGEKQRLQLIEQKAKCLEFICSMYGVGGQSLTSDDGVQLEDGSWIYNGAYDCWSD